MGNFLSIAAACLANNRGQILLVRKRGTSFFMQPGGKIEPGESPLGALVREIEEELGLRYDPDELRPLGIWNGPAANEADTSITAHLFGGTLNSTPNALAELEEVLWIDPVLALQREDIAPLLREHVLPAAIKRNCANELDATPLFVSRDI